MFDLETIIRTLGYVGIFSILFAESGLFLGFFLPGDSLLFTAGFLASQGVLNIYILLLIAFAAAVIGDNFGYTFGRLVGPKLFTKKDSLLFKRAYLDRTHEFYEKHGSKAVVLARFLPVVRTFASIMAGVGGMHYPTFILFNLIGAGLWAGGLTMAGFLLGKSIPGVDQYLLPIVLVIVVLTSLPTFTHILATKSQRQNLIAKLRRLLRLQKKS